MRENTKMLFLPVGKEQKEFRITKMDAFSGAKLLRLLSDLTEENKSRSLSDLLFALPEKEMEQVMRSCLSRAEVSLPAGYIRVWMPECWGLPELEYDTLTCLKLTLEVMAFTLNGFFPESGSPSGTGVEATCR